MVRRPGRARNIAYAAQKTIDRPSNSGLSQSVRTRAV